MKKPAADTGSSFYFHSTGPGLAGPLSPSIWACPCLSGFPLLQPEELCRPSSSYVMICHLLFHPAWAPSCALWIILAAHTLTLESFFQMQLQCKLSHLLRESFLDQRHSLLCPGLEIPGFIARCLLLLSPPHTGPRSVFQGRGCIPLAP